MRCGDRVPDVRLADGRWLHPALSPVRPTVVLAQAASVPLAAEVVLADAGDELGPRGTEAWLVRPDGHLAAVVARAGDLADAAWCRMLHSAPQGAS